MNGTDARLSVVSATGLILELPIAGPGARSYAFLIDWHIRLVVALAWWVVAAFIVSGGTMNAQGLRYFFIAVLPALLIYFLYHPVLEIAMQGRTPGKRVAGVRIVTRSGAPPGVGALLIRNVFRLVDVLPSFYCVGLVVTMFTAEHVRIGDLAAGTVLVYERAADARTEAGFLAQLPAGHADPKLTELVDDLLARWSALEPSSRSELARRLLARIDAHAEVTGADEGDLHERLRTWLARS